MRDSLKQLLESAIRYANENCSGRPADGQYCGLMADCLIKNGVRLVPPIYSEGIEKLNFTKGIYQLLRRNGIKTIDDLCSKTMREIRSMKGVGDKSFSYIVRTMEEHDLMLAPDYVE